MSDITISPRLTRKLKSKIRWLLDILPDPSTMPTASQASDLADVIRYLTHIAKEEPASCPPPDASPEFTTSPTPAAPSSPPQ